MATIRSKIFPTIKIKDTNKTPKGTLPLDTKSPDNAPSSAPSFTKLNSDGTTPISAPSSAHGVQTREASGSNPQPPITASPNFNPTKYHTLGHGMHTRTGSGSKSVDSMSKSLSGMIDPLAADDANSGVAGDDGPSITFELQTVSDTGAPSGKTRNLVLKERGVELRKGSSALWRHTADEVIGVFPAPPKVHSTPSFGPKNRAPDESAKRFTIQVITKYEFQADDPDQVQRIKDSFKALKLGGKVVIKETVLEAMTNAADQFSRMDAKSLDGLNTVRSIDTIATADQRNSSFFRPPNASGITEDFDEDELDEKKSMASFSRDAVKTSPVATRGKAAQMYSLSDFEIIKVVGEGSFGRVMKVKRKSDNLVLAMKMLKLKDYPGDPYAEQKILTDLDHPYIVKLHCWFEEDDKLYLCMDYVEHGDLFFHLRRAGSFSEEVAVFYIAEIILALDYLHRKTIVYRDLKPENVLVDADGHLKIGDLGLAKQGVTSSGGDAAQGSKAQTFCGTPSYLAPEILKGVEHGYAVDWWSAGIVLYEMLTGSVPFYSENRNEMYNKAIKGDITFPPAVSREAAKFIKGVLMKRPEDRLGSGNLGVYEIRNHPLFKNIDWKRLELKQVAPPIIPEIGADTPVYDYGLSSINGRSGEGTDVSLSRSQGLPRPVGANIRNTNDSGYGGPTRINSDFASPGTSSPQEHHSDSLVSGKSDSHSINGLDSFLSAIEKKKPDPSTSSVLDNIVDSISTNKRKH
jgi:serine/threonine protein kinase